MDGLDLEKLVIGLLGGVAVGVVVAIGSGETLVGLASGVALGSGMGIGMAVR